MTLGAGDAHSVSASLKQSSPAGRPVFDSTAVLAGCGTRAAETLCASPPWARRRPSDQRLR